MITLLTCLMLATADPVLPEADLADLTTVVHEFAGLSPRHATERRAIRLLPLTEVQLHELEESNDLDDFVDVVQALVYEVIAPEEFEYEGRSMQLMEGGRLLVTAPADVQERIAGIVDHLRGVFDREARVALSVYRLAEGRRLPEQIPVESLPALVEQGALTLVHRRLDSVHVGFTERREAQQVRTLALGWDGHIAQNSAVASPELRELETGVDLLLRAEDVPGRDALRLRYALGLSRLASLETRRSSQLNSLTLDSVMDRDIYGVAVDLPTIACAVRSGSQVLAAGEGLIDVAYSRTLRGEEAWVTHVQLLDYDAPAEPLRTGEMAVVMVDGSSMAWQPARMPRIPGSYLAGGRTNNRDGYQHREVDLPWFPAEDRGDWADSMQEYWESEFNRLEPDADEWDRWTWGMGTWALLAGRADRLERRLAGLAKLAPQPLSVRVEVGVSRASGRRDGEEELCRLTLTLEGGNQAFALLGDAVGLARGYESEVATGASTTFPQVAMVMDGALVSADADPSGNVSLSFTMHRLESLEPMDLHPLLAGNFDRPVSTTASLQAQVPADGRRHVIGELGASLDGPESTRLWARVVTR